MDLYQTNPLSSLDILANVAMLYAYQENSALMMNMMMNPEKRFHYFYEAEQNMLLHSIPYDFSQVYWNEYQSSDLNSTGSQWSAQFYPEYVSSSLLYDSQPIRRAIIKRKPSRIIKRKASRIIKKSTKKAVQNQPLDLSKKSKTTLIVAEKTCQTIDSLKASAFSTDETDITSKDAFDKVIISAGISPDIKIIPKSIKEEITADTKIVVKTPKSTYTIRGMKPRQKAKKVAEEDKDEEYFQMRKRNNKAARKSRANKNMANRYAELKLKENTSINEQLQLEVNREIMALLHARNLAQTDERLQQQILSNQDELYSFFKLMTSTWTV